MDAPGPTPFVRAAMRNCQQQLVPCSSPVHPGLGSRFAREDAPVSSSVSDRSVMEETECSSLWPPEADSRGGDLRILRHKLLTAEEKVCALTRELAQEEQARARLSHQLLALEDEYQRIQAEYAMAAELYADKHELLRKGNERVHRLAEENQNLLTCLDSKIGELRSVKKLVQNTLSQVDTKLHVLLAEGLSVVSVLTAKWRSEELQAAFERKSLSHLQLARLAVMQCGIGSPEGRGPIPPLERREHRASNQRSDATDKEEVVATLPRRCESGGPSGQLNQTERLTICTMEGREAKCAAVAFFSSTPSSAAKAGRAPASREQADPLSDKPSGRGGALRGDRSVVTGSVLPSLESSRPLVRRTMSDQFPARAGKRKSSANEVAIRRHGEKKAQHADSPHQVTARSTRHRMSLDGINQAPKRPLADSVSDPDLETSSQTCNAQKSPSVRSEHTQTGTLSAASLAKRQTMPFLLPASKAKRRLLPELHTARKLSASWAGSTLMSHRSSTATPSRSARNEPGIRAKSSSKNTTPAATFQAAARSSPFSPSAPVGKVKNPRGSLYVPNSVELRPANSHPIERSTSSATPVSAVKTGVGRTTIHSLSKGHAPTHNALPGVPASKRPSPAAAGKLLLEQPCCNVSPPGSGRGAVSPRQLSTKTPKPNCQQRSTASSGELGSGQCEAVSKDTTLAAPEAMNAGNGVLSDTEASRAPMTDSSADVSTGDRSALKLPPLPPSRWPSHVRQSLPSSIGGARRLAIQSVTSAPTGEPLSSAGSQLDSEQLDTMSGGLSSSHLVGPSCLESPFDALC
ncbi:proteophosphoglycan related protein, partial [Cystoisospora suis]